MRALVAGGSGNIGGAIVRVLAERGFAVTVADQAPVPAPTSESTADSVVADLSTESGVTEAVKVAAGDAGLDALVCAIGISPKKNGRKRPITDIDVAEWERVFAVNLTSAFLLLRAATPVLVPHANSSVVNIVSSVARLGAAGPDGSTFGPRHPAGAHYCASKAALASLTVSASRELAPLGIRCNGVAPGFIGAGMGGATEPGLRHQIVADLPLGRPGSEDEVAQVVGFLVSENASYITGEIVDVDGGWNPG
ncbi:MAG TPA: SDR family oxidoreductase [Jiangellaceae bacterium]